MPHSQVWETPVCTPHPHSSLWKCADSLRPLPITTIKFLRNALFWNVCPNHITPLPITLTCIPPQFSVDKVCTPQHGKNQDSLFSLCLEICAFPQPPKLSETAQWMRSVPIYHQHCTAASVNNTSHIYRAFVFQHSLICIGPTRFETICRTHSLLVKEEFRREKISKIWTDLNIQHLCAIVPLRCYIVIYLAWGITIKPETNATENHKMRWTTYIRPGYRQSFLPQCIIYTICKANTWELLI